MKIVSIYISFLQMNRAFQIMGILIKHSFGELFAHTRFGKRRRKVHKIVHTTPKSQPGGESGGLASSS